MNEEERIVAPRDGLRTEDHFVDITEMIESGVMPENLLSVETVLHGIEYGVPGI